MKRLVLILTAILAAGSAIPDAAAAVADFAPAEIPSSESPATAARPGLVWTPGRLPDPTDIPYNYLRNGVAMSGNVAMVGAPQKNVDGHTNAGGVYVYRKTEGGWIEQQTLVSSQPLHAGMFGSSIALRGSMAIIGESSWGLPGSTFAPDPEQGLAPPDAKAVYVYEEQAGIWTERARLVPDDGAAGEPWVGTGSTFGSSVAIDDRTAAVGAWGNMADPDRPVQGAVYVFSEDGNGWRQMQKLVGDDARAGDHFGFSVAIEGDTLLVGARGATRDRNRPTHGLLYVFERIDGVWTQTQKLYPPNAESRLQFGHSVGLDGDTAIVGAPHFGAPIGSDIPGWGKGAVFMLKRAEGLWQVSQELSLDGGEFSRDTLGAWVALSGDYAVASADQKSWTNGLVQQGAAYVFERDGGRWKRSALLTSSEGRDYGFFGTSVAVANRTVMAGTRGVAGTQVFESYRPATAQLSPASIRVVAMLDQVVQAELHIDNPGEQALDFDLAATSGAGVIALQPQSSPRPQPWPVAVDGELPSGSPLSFVLDSGNYSEPWSSSFGIGREHATIFVNRFAAPTGTGAFTLDSLSILFPSQELGSLIGNQVNLVAYYDADADGDPTNAVRLGGDQFVTIAAEDQFSTFDTDFRVPGDGDIYIGFESMYARGGSWPHLRPAALDASVPVFASSWFASMHDERAPDLDNLSANPVHGFTENFSRGGNWLIRATGADPANDCIAPSAVPWLALSPASGSVPAGASTTVTLTLDASGLAEGTYSAQLCTATSDPSRAMLRVPVTLTVTDGAIFRDGFEGAP